MGLGKETIEDPYDVGLVRSERVDYVHGFPEFLATTLSQRCGVTGSRDEDGTSVGRNRREGITSVAAAAR